MTTIKERMSSPVESPTLRRKLRAYRYVLGGMVIILPNITYITPDIRLLCVSLLGVIGFIIEGIGLANGITPDELKAQIRAEEELKDQQ